MKQSWTKGLDKELAAEIRANFKSSLVMRRKLCQILDSKGNTSIKDSRSKNGYRETNWAYKQADARGYERAIQEILDLIDENVK